MNSLCYRIVFNVRRGQLMAVAETAHSQSKAAGEGSPGGRSRRNVAKSAMVARLPLAVLVALLGVQGALNPEAHAQVVAYRPAPGNQQATVLNAGNGVPLVNIQTPSGAGVSRNTYSQFDIDAKGAVLNNSRKGAQTELAGSVGGNPWLARGTAKVILNEVVSSKPSQLRGAIEVGGDRAEVVIANPSGIDADGGRFINASRATLTTGKVHLKDGAIDHYEVRQGVITVGSGGLDTSQADYTALLSRAVKVNGALHAKELKVVTGANRISADHKDVKAIAGTGPAPEFALDVSELGGMYAGKITMVGTEAGVGVRNAGKLAASAGEVLITIDGKLVNTGQIVSQGDTDIAAVGGMSNKGSAYARGSIKVVTQRTVDNSGLIGAQGNATLLAQGEAGEILSIEGSSLLAGLMPDGSFADTGVLTLDAGRRLQASGANRAPQSIVATSPSIGVWGSDTRAPIVRLEALPNTTRRARARRDAQGNLLTTLDDGPVGSIDASNATILAEQLLLAHTDGLLRTDKAIIVTGALDIEAYELSNRGGQIVQTGSGALNIDLPGELDNTRGALYGGADGKITAGSIANDGGQLRTAGALEVEVAGHLANGSGVIAGGAGAQVVAGSLTSAGLIDGPVSTRTYLHNNGVINGSAEAGTELGNSGSINGSASARTIDNAGTVAGSASASQSLANSGAIGGDAWAGEHLTSSGQIGGSASAGGDLQNSGAIVGDAQAGHNLENEGLIGGNAQAEDNLTSTGLIGGYALAGDKLDNSGIVGQFAVAGGDLRNSGAIGEFAIAGSALDNSGSIGSLAQAGGDLVNSGAIVGSVSGANIANAGQIGGSAYAVNLIDNTGVIGTHGGGNITIGAAQVVNTGTIGGTTGNTTISAQAIDNRLGTLQAGQDLVVASTGKIDNSDGRIAAGGLLAIVDANDADNANDKTLSIVNTRGSLSAGTNMVIDSASLTFDGSVVSRGDFSAALKGDYTRTVGSDFFQAGGAVSLSFTGTVTNNTVWHVDKGLGVTGGQVINTGEISSNATTLVQATTGTLSNPGLIQGDKVVVLGVDLANQGGRIVGNTLTGVFTGNIDNTGGKIDLVGTADLQAGSNLVNDAGRIDTGSMNLNIGGNLSNKTLNESQRAGITARAGDLSLDVGGNLVVQGADLTASGKLTGFVLGDIQVGALAIDKFSATQSGGATAWLGDAASSASSEAASTHHLTTSLHAGGDLSLIAGGNASFQGADLTASGKLTLGAVIGNLSIGAVLDQTVSHSSQFTADPMVNLGDGDIASDIASDFLTLADSNTKTATGGLLTTADSKTQIAVGGQIEAGGNIDLLAGHDLNLSGVDAHAGGKLQVLAGHDIVGGSLATTSTSSNRTDDTRPANSEDTFWAAWATPSRDSSQQSTAVTQIGGHFSGATGVTFNAGHGNPFDVTLATDVQTARQSAGLGDNDSAPTATPGSLNLAGVVIAAGNATTAADLILDAAGGVDVKATWDSAVTTTATIGNVLGRLTGQNITIQSNTGKLTLAGLDIQASHDLTTYSGGDTAIDSASLRAGHDLTAYAQGRLNINGMIQNPSGVLATAETTGNDHTPVSAIATLSAGNNLTLAGIAGVQARGVDLTATNALAINTLGTLVIEGGTDHAQRGGDYIRDTARTSSLTGQTITLAALGESSDIALANVTLSSSGKTSLLATGKIGIEPGSNYSYDHWSESRSSGGWLRKKKTTTDHVRESTTVVSSSIQAGALDIHAEGDITLVATRIDSADTPSIVSGGNIQYLAAHHQSYAHDKSRTSKSFVGFTYSKSSSSHTASGQTALVTSLQSEADVFSYSTGNTTLEGTRIVSASGKVQVLAGQNIDILAAENSSFVEDKFQSWDLVGSSSTYSFNHKVKDNSSTSSTTLTGAYLSGDSVEVVAGGNAHLVATTILGKAGVSVMAGGSVLIESGQETFSTHHEHKESGHGLSVVKTDGRVHYVGPNENFEKLAENGLLQTPVFSVLDSTKGAVSIAGGGDVALLGARINAAIDVNLTAGQRLLLGGTMTGKTSGHEDETGTFICKMRDGTALDIQAGTVISGAINAGGQLNLKAGTGMDLGAVAIKSGGATVFDTPSLKLVGEKNSDYLNNKVWDKDRGYEVNQGNGHVEETLTLASIDAKGGIVLPTSTHVSVQLDGQLVNPSGAATPITPDQFTTLANQLSLQPGMGYLAELAKRPDIDWQAVSTAHQKWDYKTQGLTQAGAIVLTVVVAIVTYGAGSAAAGTTTATAVEGGAAAGGAAGGAAGSAAAGSAVTSTTTLGGVTLSTTTAAGVTSYTAAGTILNAGFTSLTTSAAVSLANNGGDLGKTLHDLGSSETVKSLLTSMATAGITNAEIFQSGDKMVSLNQLANVQTIPGLGSSAGSFSWDNLGQSALGIAGRAAVTAGVSTAINGGSFENSFKQSLVSDLAAIGANTIGTTWGGGKNPFMQTLAHAGLGCASAAATDKDCAAGAIGGASESLLGNLIPLSIDPDTGKYSTLTNALYTGGALVFADIVADATGLDSKTAMGTALNAASNNRLATQQEKDRIKQLAGGDAQKEQRLTAAMCSLIHCSAQFTEGSEAWRITRALELEGSRPEYANDRALLQNQTGMFGYTTDGLFNDKNFDTTKRINNTYGITTRVGGALQTVGGVATGVTGVGMVAVGGATCLETGVGCLVAAGGTALTGWSADQTKSGWNTVVSGQPQQTMGGAWVSDLFGISPQAGEMVYGLVGLSPAAIEAVSINRAVNGYAAANAWARGTYTGASSMSYEGGVYRYTLPEYASGTWNIYPSNIAADHRYSQPGVGAVYAGTSASTAAQEVASYQALEGRILVNGNVVVDGVLDLTNPAARQALGITMEDLTISTHGGNAYSTTQRLSNWARDQGYKAILAPSAQNPGGAPNLISFKPLSPTPGG